jgi:hypothetical protein
MNIINLATNPQDHTYLATSTCGLAFLLPFFCSIFYKAKEYSFERQQEILPLPDYTITMFISVQVTAALGRPIVQWSILEINEDTLTFSSLFEAIKAGRFEVISMSEDLKKLKLTKTFVGTKADGLMATSSNQMLRVCTQFGNYRIAGKFGGELNLAVWRSILQPPKFPTCIYRYGDPVPNRQI